MKDEYAKMAQEACEAADFHRATAIDLLVKRSKLEYRECEELIDRFFEACSTTNDIDDWMGSDSL